MRSCIIVLLLISVMACSKDKENQIPTDLTAGGTFQGTFQRKTSDGGGIVPVVLEIKGNTYSGFTPSAVFAYPVIGRGTFTIKNNVINFIDSSVYTANFDWSLILSGVYKLSVDGDSIIFTRPYDNNVKDIYKLKKK